MMLDMVGGFITEERGHIEVKVSLLEVKVFHGMNKDERNFYRARETCKHSGWIRSTTGNRKPRDPKRRDGKTGL